MKEVEGKRPRKIAEEERESLKELHFMRCPKCGMQLVEIDYRGIKIDRCTACDGVWLDAGELEEISGFDAPVMNKFFSIFK
jgi:ssDNA-binding Zn-finger/Zn-ribbon topoisomerase 1